jgi:alkylhydroperoxidase family enzyme
MRNCPIYGRDGAAPVPETAKPMGGRLWSRDFPAKEETIMARIDPLGLPEVDDEIRHLCEEAERQSGTSASTRTYARNPSVLKALTAFRTALAREGTIDPVIRELVRIKIAGLNACRY